MVGRLAALADGVPSVLAAEAAILATVNVTHYVHMACILCCLLQCLLQLIHSSTEHSSFTRIRWIQYSAESMQLVLGSAVVLVN